MNVRFTTWISEEEREKLREVAGQHGTSVNYLIRLCIRDFLGMPVPTSRLSQVTSDSSDARR